MRGGNGTNKTLYVLDTSALLAHYLGEEGADLVSSILLQDEGFVAAVTWLELRVKLKGEPDAENSIRMYEEAVAGTIQITREVAAKAFELREAAATRLPSLDALIAGSAATKGYQLVHKNSHFLSIPAPFLNQIMLPTKVAN